MKDRLDPKTPTAIILGNGRPLPDGSGLAVRTATRDGKSFYAVMVTHSAYRPVGRIVPGESATKEAVEEKVAPIQPIRIAQYKNGATTGEPGLSLAIRLHGSQRNGGRAPEADDYYLYFGTAEMGWRDGLPGVSSIMEE